MFAGRGTGSVPSQRSGLVLQPSDAALRGLQLRRMRRQRQPFPLGRAMSAPVRIVPRSGRVPDASGFRTLPRILPQILLRPVGAAVSRTALRRLPWQRKSLHFRRGVSVVVPAEGGAAATWQCHGRFQRRSVSWPLPLLPFKSLP